MKFRRNPKSVDAVRITDRTFGEQNVGKWMVQEDGQQKTFSNEDFVKLFKPGSRGDAKIAFDAAKAEVKSAAPSAAAPATMPV